MYSAISLERNRRTIQSSTSQRWDQLTIVREVLQEYPRKATFRQLRECMSVAGELGSGVYGKVYEMRLRSPHAHRMPYSFAMKMVQVNNVNRSQRLETVERVIREIHAFSYTNGLVYLNICPNFTLAPRTFFTKTLEFSGGTNAADRDGRLDGDGTRRTLSYSKHQHEQEQQQQQQRLPLSNGYTIPAPSIGPTSRTVDTKPDPAAADAAAENPKKKNMLCCMIMMERETGTIRDWLKNAKPGHLRTADVMSVVLQIFMAVCAMGKHLELCHNDLYFKNILYSRCDPREMVYKLGGAQYSIRKCNMLVKITDFGIATSPKVLFKSHTDLSHLVRSNVAVRSHSEIEFTHHILDYEGVQPYARDAAVVLRTLTLMTSLSQKVKSWALKGLLLLDEFSSAADGQRMHHWRGIVNFTGRLFHPDFLSSCNIESNLFSPVRNGMRQAQQLMPNSSSMPPTPAPPSSVPSAPPVTAEYFDVDGTRVGTDEQISELLTTQAKYFHGKK